MFTHQKLNVYRKALECAGAAERLSSTWPKTHSFVDHFRRASESIVLNIAEGARLPVGPGKVLSLDYAVGSALECAACLDIAGVKRLLSSEETLGEKRQLWEVTRMLIGLRKSWCYPSIHEEAPLYQTNHSSHDEDRLFHHERLDVYEVSLQFMRWFVSLPTAAEPCARVYRQLDKSATSIVLNIAEGNGRYSELDHRRFLDLAAAAAVKSAAYLDLWEHNRGSVRMDMSGGHDLLGRITAMLSHF